MRDRNQILIWLAVFTKNRQLSAAKLIPTFSQSSDEFLLTSTMNRAEG